MGKNANVQKILEKHDVNQYSTYSTLKASIARSRMNVEDVYTQQQQVGRRAAASRVRLQRKHRLAIRRFFCNCRKTLNTVYSAIKILQNSK